MQPQPGVAVNFLRSDPTEGFSIIGVDTIILYFDNRPTDVKIKEASEEITKAIVKGNTVEISIKQPVFVPDIHFTVTWAGGKVLLYYLNEPDDTVADFRRSDPADGSSIIGVETVRVSLNTHPRNVKCYNHTSESFIEDVTVLHSMIEFPVPHPIKEPSISFTVSWTSRDKTAKNSIKLTYTNEDVAPEE